uniref:Slack isoform 2 n=1 Tax=Aplysia californica TaxID=6500 RepID=K4EMG9_APLCA|nr:slack isoform 2 [Aplysia californica]
MASLETDVIVTDVYGLNSDSDSDSCDNVCNIDTYVDGSAPVKYFTHELSCRGRLRRFFIRNASTRIASTFFDLALKSLICIMYVVRVYLDNPSEYECDGHPCRSAGNTTQSERQELYSRSDINWYVLLWVHRSLPIWITELCLAFVSLIKAMLLVYIATKGHRMEQILTKNFFLEIICAVPMLATLAYPPVLKDLFVPVFFNCWLAKRALEKIYNDLHLTRQRFQTISVTSLQQMVLVLANIACLVFVCICCIQHIQRGSEETPLSMFQAFYFVIVTFSTVGYGDISPDIWLSRLFMVLMICVAFASIPRQIEGLVSTYMERRKAGGEYSHRSATRNKHVIVCSSSLTQDTLMDFLNEFYAHPKLEEHTVILLCSQELDSSKQVILKDPKWSHRVIYMKGSSLKDIDLKRCRVHQADACFFLAPRPSPDKAKADRHTILRSWAVKDFAPNCKQYIQLFSVANKIHVKFAEHVVCEDEFKYALLANNCLYPGLSTLVSLLVHTSTGLQIANIDWSR